MAQVRNDGGRKLPAGAAGMQDAGNRSVRFRAGVGQHLQQRRADGADFRGGFSAQMNEILGQLARNERDAPAARQTRENRVEHDNQTASPMAKRGRRAMPARA